MYVLLTSLEPLTAYIYDDGLVRLATEPYSSHPGSAGDACVHVTNFAVNLRDNADKFERSSSVSAADGHKWRLRVLWSYLHGCGWGEHQLEQVWAGVEEVVVKSLLCAHSDMLEEFRAKASKSAYNAYKLLGYDLLLDQDLK